MRFGETRGQQDAGCLAQFGVDLADHLKAGLCASGSVHTANNIIGSHFGRIQDGAGNGQGGCAVACTAGDKRKVHSTVIVEAGDVVHICRQRGGVFLHHQLFQQNAHFVDLSNAIIDLHRGFVQGGDVLLIFRIKNIDYDDRCSANHLEVGGDCLAKGVLCKIAGPAHRCHSLLVGADVQRGVYCRRRVCQLVDRGSANDDL